MNAFALVYVDKFRWNISSSTHSEIKRSGKEKEQKKYVAQLFPLLLYISFSFTESQQLHCRRFIVHHTFQHRFVSSFRNLLESDL